MFKEEQADKKIKKIIDELGNHAINKSHSRHFSPKKLIDFGLKVEWLEDNQKLQDAVLALHHACMITFTTTNAVKIIENQEGKAFIQSTNP